MSAWLNGANRLVYAQVDMLTKNMTTKSPNPKYHPFYYQITSVFVAEFDLSMGLSHGLERIRC